MKKKNIFGLLLGVSLLFPLHVGALETTTSVACTPNKISSGATVTCSFKTNVTSGKISGFGAKYDLGEGVVYVADSFTAGPSIPVTGANGNGFMLSGANGFDGSISLGTAKFTVTGNPGNYKIGIKDLDLSDDSAVSSSEDPRSTTVRIQSSVNTLSGLTIEPNGYSEDKITEMALDRSTNLLVSAVVEADSIKINATPTDSAATVSGDGVQSLAYGTNEKNITVTAEDGTTKTYKLIIVRPDHRNSNNFLKSLTIEGYSIKFNKSTLEYSIEVPNSVSKLDIKAVAEDSTAKVEIKNNNLKVGKNQVQVIVTAENESQKIYTINVQKDMLIKIPNTAAGRSILATIISLILIGTGSFIVFSNKNKKVNS